MNLQKKLPSEHTADLFSDEVPQWNLVVNDSGIIDDAVQYRVTPTGFNRRAGTEQPAQPPSHL
jgi:hypothetical protein